MLCTSGSRTVAGPRRVAVVVIHGIGQQRRGECAGALAGNVYRAMCANAACVAVSGPECLLEGGADILRMQVLLRCGGSDCDERHERRATAGSRAGLPVQSDEVSQHRTSEASRHVVIDLQEFYWGPLACSHVSLVELAMWSAVNTGRYLRAVVRGECSWKAVVDCAQIVTVAAVTRVVSAAACGHAAPVSSASLAVVAWLLLLYSFLQNYVADVLRYFCLNEYRPHFRVRRRIQSAGLRKLRSVMRADGASGYDDVLIVAHSLGTVIAADLLRLLDAGGECGARGDASRLRGLITLGSPLAKCERLGLVGRSAGVRAQGYAPNARNGEGVRWLNVYYQLDPVADRLVGWSVAEAVARDVRFSSGAPFVCHTGYWGDERVGKLVVEELVRCAARCNAEA